MKPLLILLLSVLINTLEGQVIDSVKEHKYAVGFNRFMSRSGFMPGTSVYFTYIAQNKNIGLGFMYCPEQKKISGITLHHEITLSSPLKSNFSPYLFYNMMYRFTRTNALPDDQLKESTYGLYKCMEHHIGVGMNVRIINNFHIKTAFGYGVYFGSIKKPVVDTFTKEVSGSNGFSAIGMIALEYAF